MSHRILIMAAALCMPLCSEASLVGFGSAEKYVMAAGGHSSIILGSSAHLAGNVAAGFYLNIGSGARIEGDACAPAMGVGAGVLIQGSRTCANANLYNDILAGSRALAGLPLSPYFDINSSMTLQAGNYQVGTLLLDSGEFLTIKGRPEDVVVINVTAEAKLGSGAGILLSGGIKSSNVYFNFVGTPRFSSFEFGGANLSGTFVSDSRSFIMGDGATLNNTRFFTNGNIIANVQTVKYDPQFISGPVVDDPALPLPEDVSAPVGALGGVFLLALWWRNLRSKRQ